MGRPERWQIDFKGPLPQPPSKWEYILTGVEIISVLGMAYPCPQASAKCLSFGSGQWFTHLPLPSEMQPDTLGHTSKIKIYRGGLKPKELDGFSTFLTIPSLMVLLNAAMDFVRLYYDFALGPVSPKPQLVPPHFTGGHITLPMQSLP